MPTPLKAGDPAPDFSATTTDGRKVALKDFRGRKLVMYFYPMDDTPGCTKQACSLRDHNADIVAKGAAVLGVSTQDEASHQKFTRKYKLNFPLLADEGNEVATKFGAYGEKTLYGRKFMGIIRSTFIIDGEGVVRKVFPRVKVDGHAGKVLEAVEKIRKGE